MTPARRPIMLLLMALCLSACEVRLPIETKPIAKRTEARRAPKVIQPATAAGKQEASFSSSDIREATIVRPRREAAVLFIEDNFAFAKGNAFTGGPEVYKYEVEGLADLLSEEGLDVSVERISYSSMAIEQLSKYRMIYIVDTFFIFPELRELIEQYVDGGGVLVGICEVGRFTGVWEKPWPFSELFGLKTKPVDKYDTGVTADGGLYRYAERTLPDSPLLRGLGDRIDWGIRARQAWATEADTAEVHAYFPAHMATVAGSESATHVEKPIPAVAVNRYGDGTAIFFAVLPTGRTSDGWRYSAKSATVYAQARAYAKRQLRIHKEDPDFIVGFNQMGYEPEDPKKIIVRTTRLKEDRALQGSFLLIDSEGTEIRKGPLEQPDTFLWNSHYLTADLSDLRTEGQYMLEIHIPDFSKVLRRPFRIHDGLRKSNLLPSQVNFFNKMRCGEVCHRTDPVRGGFHDATGDWGTRMWAIPHVVWCLTRYLETDPFYREMMDELRWGVDWLVKMQKEDGSLHASVVSPTGMSPLDLRPPQDKTQRQLGKLKPYLDFNYTATYCAAMARASLILRQAGDARASRCIAAAQRSFERIRNRQTITTSELGNRAWAAMEMYRVSKRKEFIDIAKRDATVIVKRQLLKGRVVDGDIYGDFFAKPGTLSFSPQQWKVFHSIGIYLSLIQLEEHLPSNDALAPQIRLALNQFMKGYVEGMSSLTPYGQMANGLEPNGVDKFKVYHFSHYASWIKDHGLNCDMFAMALLGLERNRGRTSEPVFREIAHRQIHWLVGFNPLGYSMIQGFGDELSPMIDASKGTGPIKGGIANGIIGRGRDNLPAWGPSWDSREYWLPHNAYLIALIGLLDN